MKRSTQVMASEIQLTQKRDTYLLRSSRALIKNPTAIFGLVLVILILTSSIFANWIAPYGPTSQDLNNTLQPPSKENLMGTDTYGRDVLSRIVWGSRSSLRIGLLATLLGLAVGTMLGILAGYLGGKWDVFLMRIVDSILSFPTILLALIVIATLGAGEKNVIIAIGFASIPRFARLVRADTLTVMNKEYISSAIVNGCKLPRIIIRHIFPNVSPTIIIMATLEISNAILYEASLSFLGVGTLPPTPSWGLMISSHRGILHIAPWTVLFPGLAILLTVLGFNLFGDGLRDALDPKLSS